MGLPGGLEWIIVLIVIVLLFGVGRLGRIGGELGSAIRNFREGLKSDEEKKDEKKPDDKPDDKTA